VICIYGAWTPVVVSVPVSPVIVNTAEPELIKPADNIPVMLACTSATAAAVDSTVWIPAPVAYATVEILVEGGACMSEYSVDPVVTKDKLPLYRFVLQVTVPAV
jgi:hypothetical protein